MRGSEQKKWGLHGVVYSSHGANGLSKLRNVTWVFLKLGNHKFDSTETIAVMQVFFLSMQMCLADCSGFLCQFLVDDKWYVLIGQLLSSLAMNSTNSHHAEGSSRDGALRVNRVGSTTAQ
jgi:hypothetical protein